MSKRLKVSTMVLAIAPPFPPMEARSVATPPIGEEWQYEPKWDGFRCIAFRDGADVYLQSKSGQPLARYFPDVVDAIGQLVPRQFVLDGEILIPVQGRSSFDQLLMRVHPAASRVRKLASDYPALYVVFDLLVDSSGHSRVEDALVERRAALEQFAKTSLVHNRRIRLSPATLALTTARRWLTSVGTGLDGMIAKRRDLPYRSGTRDGMQKIKQRRTADCVVGGFRYAEGEHVIGSLLLGMYDQDGKLNHVGFTSSFSTSVRKELAELVEPLKGAPGFTGKAPGGPSRWSTRRSSEWEPLKTKLVVEVQYDTFTGGRFRHGTKLVRFRPDKRPRACTDDQIATRRGVKLKLLGI